MKTEDEKYMKRCLQLAAGGRGQVAPNPMVGSVIVADGKIIGEGFHRQYGGPHAEVHAIASVKDSALFSRSVLYVNLEPCSHYGKTPPCAGLIIQKGIPKVVIGCLDPFPSVSGRGVKMLRDAGVEVITGCLEEEAQELNRVFITAHTTNRPYIFLKWAQSADGFLDKVREDVHQPPVVFSSAVSSQAVHKRRTETEAILIGTHTALLDNPSLTVRSWYGKSPVRCVIDRELVIPEHFHLVDGTVETLIFTKYRRKKQKNIEYITIDFDGNEISSILDFLYKRKITSLMVEGGGILLTGFLQKSLWDEIRVETSSVYLEEGIPAPVPECYLKGNRYRVCRDSSYISYLRRLNSF